MKSIRSGIVFFTFLFALVSSSYAQTTGFTEVIKKHMNETVQDVKAAEEADDKRQLLNESYDKILAVIDETESRLPLSETETAQLNLFKNDILEKSNQLNGRDGFTRIRDENLNDFSDYSQQEMEQADRFITISVSTAILVILLLLLL